MPNISGDPSGRRRSCPKKLAASDRPAALTAALKRVVSVMTRLTAAATAAVAHDAEPVGIADPQPAHALVHGQQDGSGEARIRRTELPSWGIGHQYRIATAGQELEMQDTRIGGPIHAVHWRATSLDTRG